MSIREAVLSSLNQSIRLSVPGVNLAFKMAFIVSERATWWYVSSPGERLTPAWLRMAVM